MGKNLWMSVLVGVGLMFAPFSTFAELDTDGKFGIGNCRRGTTTEVGDEEYLTTSGVTAVVCFEPDTAGAFTVAEITLYTCMTHDATSCVEEWFDYDFDGVPDGPILDGVSLGQRCVAIDTNMYLRIYTSTAPGAVTEIAKWSVCGLES